MLFVHPDLAYIDYLDFKVLICLLVLMLSVELFQEARLFAAIAAGLLSRVSGLRRLTLVLTALTFVSAMFLTNDVALITLIPLSLLIFNLLEDTGAVIRVIVLQTVAANVGSSLTPIGNPQNLFLYTHYQLDLLTFLKAVGPIVLAGAILLTFLILISSDRSLRACVQSIKIERGRSFFLGLVLFPAAVACVFGLWSEWLLLGLALLLLLPLRPKMLIKADWPLLLTFVCFFVFIGNISRISAVQQFFADWLEGQHRVLLAGAMLSQVISNVPAAILLASFTDQSLQLIRGVNIGGCGTLIASLASVITFRIFSREAAVGHDKRRFMLIFTGYNLLFLGVLLAVGIASNE
jgi:Na+/H+ antiporter NhaD/arsenite permease-like protein